MICSCKHSEDCVLFCDSMMKFHSEKERGNLTREEVRSYLFGLGYKPRDLSASTLDAFVEALNSLSLSEESFTSQEDYEEEEEEVKEEVYEEEVGSFDQDSLSDLLTTITIPSSKRKKSKNTDPVERYRQYSQMWAQKPYLRRISEPKK